MFRHLLVPTDGSSLSDSAVKNAVAFAKQLGARVTGIHVIPQFRVFTYRPEMLEDTEEQYLESARNLATAALTVLTEAAQAAGVECDVVSITNDHPYDAIISTAQARGCDLIAMASHGRRGIEGMLIGSETQKVLTHSTLPVLVFR